MKEKIFKKGFTRRLFSVVLAQLFGQIESKKNLISQVRELQFIAGNIAPICRKAHSI